MLCGLETLDCIIMHVMCSCLAMGEELFTCTHSTVSCDAPMYIRESCDPNKHCYSQVWCSVVGGCLHSSIGSWFEGL